MAQNIGMILFQSQNILLQLFKSTDSIAQFCQMLNFCQQLKLKHFTVFVGYIFPYYFVLIFEQIQIKMETEIFQNIIFVEDRLQIYPGQCFLSRSFLWGAVFQIILSTFLPCFLKLFSRRKKKFVFNLPSPVYFMCQMFRSMRINVYRIQGLVLFHLVDK